MKVDIEAVAKDIAALHTITCATISPQCYYAE